MPPGRREMVGLVLREELVAASLKSDMCVCMPEPFSPKSGFGMKVA